MGFSIVNDGVTAENYFRFHLNKTFGDALENIEIVSFELTLESIFQQTVTPKSAEAELKMAPKLAAARQMIKASGIFGK